MTGVWTKITSQHIPLFLFLHLYEYKMDKTTWGDLVILSYGTDVLDLTFHLPYLLVDHQTFLSISFILSHNSHLWLHFTLCAMVVNVFNDLNVYGCDSMDFHFTVSFSEIFVL